MPESPIKIIILSVVIAIVICSFLAWYFYRTRINRQNDYDANNRLLDNINVDIPDGQNNNESYQAHYEIGLVYDYEEIQLCNKSVVDIQKIAKGVFTSVHKVEIDSMIYALKKIQIGGMLIYSNLSNNGNIRQ